MSQTRKQGRPPNTADRPYRPPERPEQTRRSPSEVEDPQLREVARSLVAARQAVTTAEGVLDRARVDRVQQIIQAKKTLEALRESAGRERGLPGGNQAIEGFIAEFAGVTARRVHELLQPKRSSS
jgi:hypothetical protein